MQRPQVRQIEQQQETSREVTGSEADELLRKYGYENKQHSSLPEAEQPKQKGMTFEEMAQQQDEKEKRVTEARRQKQSGAKPKTFQTNNGYDSITSYGTDDELGFGFKIEITSDMKLPKY